MLRSISVLLLGPALVLAQDIFEADAEAFEAAREPAEVTTADTQSYPESGDQALVGEAPLSELIILRDAFLSADDFSGALRPAREVVEQTAAAVGEDDPQLVPHLTALAEVHRELGEFEPAEANYLRSISILEAQGKKFPAELVEPYHGLGKTYIRAGRYGAALTVLDEARHISRRNSGLFNVDQIELIDDQTRALIGIGDTRRARDLQLERLSLAERSFGEDPELVPYLYDLASYYAQSRMVGSAREQYERALEVLDNAEGANDPDLLPTLRAIVDLNLGVRDTGEEAQRIRTILDTHGNIAPAERARSLVSLGDWHATRDDVGEALAYYRAAYAIADSELQAELFAKPVMLNFVAPFLNLSKRKTRGRTLHMGEISFTLTVTGSGTTIDPQVEYATPPGLVEEDYLTRMAQARFRPRFVKGEPVATPGVRVRHGFWYFVKN